MKRTTVMLPVELKMQAQKAAQSRGISLGTLIRESLRSALAADPEVDSLFADGEVFSGETPSDLAARHDDYLYDD
ncbi:MAG: antitoxin [Armatimonadetes bacterium]|nr:antitoxin [Armatimonadota bacterium]